MNCTHLYTYFNGVNINECIISDNVISIKMNSPFNWSAKPILIFHNGEKNQIYKIIINDNVIGDYDFQQLNSGIAIPF